MAKKKKQTRKKVEQEVVERSAFWPLAAAIIMFLLAMFLLLGGFASGGPLPKNLFHGTYIALGLAAYLTPLALIFFGVHKFKSEDRKVPLSKLTSMVALLIFAACWLQVAFVTKLASASYVGGHGGAVGKWIGGGVLTALDKMPAAVLFFVLTFLMFFLAFGISPKVILVLFSFL
ncbi:MAG: hypothetical protein NVSMB46_00740 [Candidatus Saccharimonadales bacterium]